MTNFVKKTITLDEDLVRKVRKIFDAKTDKDAVNQALQLVASEDDLIRIHAQLAGSLPLEDVFS